MSKMNYEKKISILDWGIVISVILLLLSVFLPQIIWKEENFFKKESRYRMSAIAKAQEFYFEMTGQYSLNGEHVFNIVEAAMDSLIADSLFLGDRIINLDGNAFAVNMEKGLEIRIDTTFSEPTDIYSMYVDTIYNVGMKNIESGGIDTIFVNNRDLKKYKLDEHFHAVYGLEIVNRTELKTDYLRKKYHLDQSMLFCPLTNQPYIFEIDTTGGESVFLVKSPLITLDKPYTESRFVVFTFEAGDHGFIKGDQKSWAE